MKGKLYLIPTTLGESPVNNVIPEYIKEVVNSTQYYIVENIRTVRRYLRKLDNNCPIDDFTFYELNKHTSPDDINGYLKPLLEGNNIGLISEAGAPGVADPGADIVKIAHEKNIRVIPLVGPSSILLSLMASGMNGQNFAFVGYLPIQQAERIKKLQSLEKRSQIENQTQIFIEAPYRNDKLLQDILKGCKPDTRLCIAVDITLDTEFIQTKPVSQWKKSFPDINKRPAIFLIHG